MNQRRAVKHPGPGPATWHCATQFCLLPGDGQAPPELTVAGSDGLGPRLCHGSVSISPVSRAEAGGGPGTAYRQD